MYKFLLQYSDAFQAHDDRISSLIIQTHAVALVEKLIDKVNASNLESGHLTDDLSRFVLDNVSSLNEPFEPFWDTAFGRAQRCLEDEEVSASDALCLVALRIANFGARGSCTGKFSKPVKITWNEYLLPEMDEFSLNCLGSHLRMCGSVRGHTAFVLEKNGNDVFIRDPLNDDLKVLDRASGILLMSGDSVLDGVIIEDEFHSIFSYPPIDGEIINEYDQGLHLLSAVPEYELWVRRIVRGIVVCETVGSRTRSSSWSEAPGLVLVSRSNRAYLLAEMLVHEASHQYYNLVSRCGSTVTGTDTRLYYSPAVNRSRPLEKVLLGYHAFANIFLFYNKYLKVAGLYTDEIEHTLAMFIDKLPHFEQPLLETNGLSEIGQALFHPLYNNVCKVRHEQVNTQFAR